MTYGNAVNNAIAAHCGWTMICPLEGQENVYRGFPPKEDDQYARKIPNYSGELSEMRKAEKYLSSDEFARYNVAKALLKDPQEKYPTARNKAEAYCMAIDKTEKIDTSPIPELGYIPEKWVVLKDTVYLAESALRAAEHYMTADIERIEKMSDLSKNGKEVLLRQVKKDLDACNKALEALAKPESKNA